MHPESVIAEANANCELEVEIGQGGTDAWLTPVSECQWGGVACDSVSSDMERIEFGEFVCLVASRIEQTNEVLSIDAT